MDKVNVKIDEGKEEKQNRLSRANRTGCQE